MGKKAKLPEPIPVDFAQTLSERYLSYAMSTIMARSLPDVRDGLKPVHRRLLHAMRLLRLDPRSGFKKCARVVGDVIGKYHPHGEVAVYDAMVRLAQEFAVRYPLVDGQGNFGSIDGDGAAAMRYTEARLTEVAEALLEGLDEETVDFRATYDGEEEEPVVLPATFPNLLANGASGIAVGMATSIPPHNAHELCDALLHLIKKPNARIETLVDLVPGPDFPTGGVLVETRESIATAYKTGRGAFRVRARWHEEKASHGRYRIIVTELPYQVQKARLIEKVAELMTAKKLPWLADIVDESAEDIRLALEPRSRTVEAGALMESLFRLSDLESRVSLNLNVLDADNTPKVMSLAEVLQAFLDHRRIVLQRRGRYRLGKINTRLEVLKGFLVAFVNLGKIIRIIREDDEPKATMMARWDLSDVQAEAILNMRLRALRRLEEIAIRKELEGLGEERDMLTALLADEKRQWRAIGNEVKDIRARFGRDTVLGARRTEIGEAPSVEVVPLEAMVEREPITIICSEKGWIRTVRGHLAEDTEIKIKEGDRIWRRLHAQSTDKLVVFATNGRFYTLPCDRLPGGRGFGEPLRLMVDLSNEHDLVELMVHQPDQKLLVAASDGRGFIVETDEIVAQKRGGRQVLNVSGEVEAVVCVLAEGDRLAVVGENHKLLVFGLDELPVMTRGRGVILQKYRDGGLSDARCFSGGAGLTWRQGSRLRTLTELGDWISKRGNAGRLAPKGFPRHNRFR
ncbi:MAG: DNA topoisomerase IV subunit A [Alphaproteobacteria bacterium]|jgi:topoisomerase-4 subunit A|nr:DNA topoisomerase IV subunit A [Alphaproteobacteria bacterium]MDP6237947.1 DNA topoisomerase IV subunit A [Alphaproteobacteria bacterium]MDP7173006.1 DNA topoisomerase IV subunit A [Alphaproteobacteria bacterium]MDP7486659.1 DNA topoisomerase IV subunit A [Alphaproteobacteria bacterium]|tara:strand:+ start:16 stop:2238 length:2223 start_codon:yes stop_codon:yes gene_type:complete